MEIDTRPLGEDDTTGLRQSCKAEKSGKGQIERNPGDEAADEAGLSGFSEHSRQHPVDSSLRVQGHHKKPTSGETNGAGDEMDQMTCNWIQRWLQPNSHLLITTLNGRSRSWDYRSQFCTLDQG
ncbi:hypothetical protein R1flu_013154 [Riccia fluitans]|uniref:Uncharacterized protein n=1 Tax=Riccia fluitans TaxID=41844 RepID=A0ABD1XE45_9MARC